MFSNPRPKLTKFLLLIPDKPEFFGGDGSIVYWVLGDGSKCLREGAGAVVEDNPYPLIFGSLIIGLLKV